MSFDNSVSIFVEIRHNSRPGFSPLVCQAVEVPHDGQFGFFSALKAEEEREFLNLVDEVAEDNAARLAEWSAKPKKDRPKRKPMAMKVFAAVEVLKDNGRVLKLAANAGRTWINGVERLIPSPGFAATSVALAKHDHKAWFVSEEARLHAAAEAASMRQRARSAS